MSTTLCSLLLEQARLNPEQTAVICGNQHLSMSQLVTKAAEVASFLQQEGVPPGHCVALYTEPSLDLMLGVWGILLAGCTYLPVSPDYPRERVQYMLEHSQTSVILCEQNQLDKLKMLVPRDVQVFAISDAMASQSANFSHLPVNHLVPNDAAYVIYTSGSTGKPKGAVIEHQNIVSQMRWLHTAHGIGRETVILQKTPVSFDAAQWEILSPVCGATVVMATKGAHRNTREIIRLIQDHNVTALQCVPTLLQALVESEAFRKCTSIRQIFSGGEALTRQLALNCTEMLPGRQLVNLYGPTECTINASSHVFDPTIADNGAVTVPIGMPVDGTTFHVLDNSMTSVAKGEAGELFISGKLVGRGYLNEPALTGERFIKNPLSSSPDHHRLYRTGDLVRRNSDGTFQYVGRTDNQIKLRGHRIELDEIRSTIESFEWVRHAAVITKTSSGNCQRLISFVELNTTKAALMDQGLDEMHHRSKACRSQVRAQLSNPGCRELGELENKMSFDLPGLIPTLEQKRRVYARKTYRFYEGGAVRKADILALLASETISGCPQTLGNLDISEFGEIIRYLGQFVGNDRLLPKYGYASPGALYATQIYLEISGFAGFPSGYYYYHPVYHRLFLIEERPAIEEVRINFHFVGKRCAIDPVYKKNILEVLEIETGHIVGLLEEVLPMYGLSIGDIAPTPEVVSRFEVNPDDYYLGSFKIDSGNAARIQDEFDIYVQSHPGKIPDLPAGQYRYTNGSLEWISNDLILRQDVIAINQGVYDRSSFGISLISRTRKEHLPYVDLGRKLQHFQMNKHGLGLMSSGYSSKSGFDLPSARRITEILTATGRNGGPSYFCIGGRVSQEQIESEGMKEDAVHMKGPAEMLKDALAEKLPDYMVPSRVVILDRMPLTANGKVDVSAVRESEIDVVERPKIEPRSETEEKLCTIWSQVLKCKVDDVQSDFFEVGGNSIAAVELVHRVNTEMGLSLPLQVLHEAPTIEQLTRRIISEPAKCHSRLVCLSEKKVGQSIFIWPGLGGIPTNLRLLARRMSENCFGVQAHGLNTGETPFCSLQEMASRDVKLIQEMQVSGPYRLYGYSFGARVAFETAFQLEQQGEIVEELILIAPGSPKIQESGRVGESINAAFDCPVFVSVLYSVFAGNLAEPMRTRCLDATRDKKSFAAFICEHFPNVRSDFVDRVIDLVALTYEFNYKTAELLLRRIKAPITVFRAQGDDTSFIDRSAAYSATAPEFVNLTAGHYNVLREPAIDELISLMTLSGNEKGEFQCPTSTSNIFPSSLVRNRKPSLPWTLPTSWSPSSAVNRKLFR